MRRLLLVPLAVTLACATVPGPAATTSPPTATAARTPAGAVNDTLIPHIRWVRSSAEYRALALQAYRLATQEIERRVVGVPPGTWAVILDADETVLDNSEYQQSREGRGLLYTPETWTEWAQRGVAPAVPGSVAFTHRIRSMGGRVVIVTNRDQAECEGTRENLRRLTVPAAAVLCKEAVSDKNPRFEAVAAGTAGLPPLRILMWVGDNIQDFPRASQALRNAPESELAQFGREYIVLPNPMYGSWTRSPLPVR